MLRKAKKSFAIRQISISFALTKNKLFMKTKQTLLFLSLILLWSVQFKSNIRNTELIFSENYSEMMSIKKDTIKDPELPAITNYFQIGANLGYDIPDVKNHLAYAEIQNGLKFGVNLNYYWKYFGVGFDVDYFQNNMKNLYPTTNLKYGATSLNNLQNTEGKISRLFFGVGPNFKTNEAKKISAELYGRIGLANISGGELLLKDNTANVTLNKYNGFDSKSLLSFKGGLNLLFNIKENVALSLGGYYIKHQKTTELLSGSSYSAYREFTNANNTNNVTDNVKYRNKECNCDFDSYGVTLGLNYRFGIKKKQNNALPIDESQKTQSKDNNSILVNTLDKITNERLADVNVNLYDSGGQLIGNKITDASGIVSFENLPYDTYSITSTFYGEPLENATIESAEFDKNPAAFKNLYFTQKQIIVRGNITDCNTHAPIGNALIYAESSNPEYNKTAKSDANGNFILILQNNLRYRIYASKELYFSEIKEITTSKTVGGSVYMDLNICADNAGCGNKVTLNKIYYDFDKATLRMEAYPELNKLLQFLKDNPNANVELSSHTDARGSDEYNQRLSNERAKSVVDYLIANGITKSRLIAVGMGEKAILNQCVNGATCRDVEHEVNRRTEMKVICPDQKK